jgi:hypothetical protein
MPSWQQLAASVAVPVEDASNLIAEAAFHAIPLEVATGGPGGMELGDEPAGGIGCRPQDAGLYRPAVRITR